MYSYEKSKITDTSHTWKSSAVGKKNTNTAVANQLFSGPMQVDSGGRNAIRFHGRLTQHIDSHNNETGLPDSLKSRMEPFWEYRRDDGQSPKFAKSEFPIAFQMAESSNAISQEASRTSDLHEAIVQRELNTDGLDRNKHHNIIKERQLWNRVFDLLLKILPSEEQGVYGQEIARLEERFANDIYFVPHDDHYAYMTDYFSQSAGRVMNSLQSPGSVTEAVLSTGGSAHVVKNTSGHTNTQTRMAIKTAGGGVVYINEGKTREHGIQIANRRQHEKKNEKNDEKRSLLIMQNNVANQVMKVHDLLLGEGKEGAAEILRRFAENFKIQ
ncbi:MAG: hypothetical protein J1E61_00835 [Lachnospiraceae bacterium]|nr:hypothetical protein [Lachnospiraceae bacterium]